MSYDLQLVRFYPGQSWEQAIEVHYGFADPPLELPSPEADLAALAGRIREVLGPAVELEHGVEELRGFDPGTGIQLDLTADQGEINVPYVDDEAEFTAALVRARAVARDITAATGLRGWDAQTEEPLDS